MYFFIFRIFVYFCISAAPQRPAYITVPVPGCHTTSELIEFAVSWGGAGLGPGTAAGQLGAFH
jgi:hypothetical protein